MSLPVFRARVRSYELDALGHANHAVYLNWLEQARWDALAEAGLPAPEILRRGWGIHVVRIEVDYRAECRLNDDIRIETGVERLKNSSMILVQRLFRSGLGEAGGTDGADSKETLAAEARVVAVWIGSDRKPMRIPPEVRSGFAAWARNHAD
jgi:thioesterase III